MPRPRAILLGLLAVALISAASLSAEGPAGTKTAAPKFTAAQVAFFEKEVRPLLEARCLKCHGGGDKVRGGLRLTSREEVLKGGDSGPAVDLGNTDGSLLLKAIHYGDGTQIKMPPKGKLGDKEIATLVKWVGAGLPYPSGKAIVTAPPKHRGGVVTPESRNYWAYRALARPTPPAVKDAGWVNNPIDAFILAKLEAKGLQPNPRADKLTLIRRVYYDLIGLPPTPEEITGFVADTSPRAYEKLVDKLLDSPHYGEKWGRHWLDLVRYAETNGYERDGPKPYAWRFRDYVIRSFNADKPYDLFVKEQIAGDEMPDWNPDHIIATGYYRLGIWDDEPADPSQSLFDDYDDIVATTGQVFLGMTMNCARCHDHKIDPIPQADYYRLLAFFADIPRFSNDRNPRSAGNMSDITAPELRVKYEAALKAREARIIELTKAMTKIEDAVIQRMPAEDRQAAAANDRAAVIARKLKQFIKPDEDGEYRKLKSEMAGLKKKPEPPGRELALSVNNCFVRPPQTFILGRGSVHAPGAKVAPGFPAVLGFSDPVIPAPGPGAKSSGRRTALANWLTRKDNPVPARVMANRLWQHHFGRGIVASSNDFGQFGVPPTHPELLDWLAKELQDGGWKLKRMHKLILMSNTYQQASTGKRPSLAADPENHLWWRYPMRRLTAEEMRDSILAVSGRLNAKMYGESIFPPIPKEVLAGQSVPGQGWGKSSPEEASRRSVYVCIKRSLLVPILSQHDQADTDSSCPVRYTTTVPTTALGMLNGEFTNEQAGFLADRLRKEAPNDVRAQIRRAIALTTGRQAGEAEVKADASLIEKLETKHHLSAAAALKLYCLLLLNANEFAYID